MQYSTFMNNLPCAGPILALAAAALLVLAPVGWRMKWWHYRTAFMQLMLLAVVLALLAAAVCITVIVSQWASLTAGEAFGQVAALIVALAVVGIPASFGWKAATVPQIHDITTDTHEPPQFVAVLPMRKAEDANSVDYGGAEIAAQQKRAYPEIQPLTVPMGHGDAFKLASTAAKAMPKWTLVSEDAAAGRIEASETSRWFKFTDDIVIRVRGDQTESRIDVRSTSRQGDSDLGVNADRIRRYMEKLRDRV